ncbi:MAG: thioredoxin domain-containing protein [Balneolaceae bacterium]
MSNRLTLEKSPYLLQHADNPVDWHPWSEEAFQIAKDADKPVFVSIGYSTCHWCHVMAEESFEDPEIARLMNQAFINIKVDREERPDIDHACMTVCQMLTGQGGWPLNLLLTPDRQPFFAATYLPKESRGNRTGMADLIPGIARFWRDEREKLLASANKISESFKQTTLPDEPSMPGEELLHDAFRDLSGSFDRRDGGFGSAPKFPTPHTLSWLVQYGKHFGEPEAIKMAVHTLERMRLGGIWDHIGYGFHRYSTTRNWLIPHFEKMLYDQAMLIRAYTDAWAETRDPLFRETVLQTAAYTVERLHSPEGAFWSAEDADSDGEEGLYYLWRQEELETLLDQNQLEFFASLYGIKHEGNFRDEFTGAAVGRNIPHLKHRKVESAERLGISPESLDEKLEPIRKTLLDNRLLRSAPSLDDKILTDWNGLMIGALAHAGTLLEEPKLIRQAVEAWDFLKQKLRTDDEWLHRYREGEAAIPAMADDYAFLTGGLIDLFEATLDPHYLLEAETLARQFAENHHDSEAGGFFFSNRNETGFPGPQKWIHDGAIPSSNSMASLQFIRLSRYSGEVEFEELGRGVLSAFHTWLEKAPSGTTCALQALLLSVTATSEVVVSGPSLSDSGVQKMIHAVRSATKQPLFLLVKTPENASVLDAAAPFTRNFPVGSEATAWVCRDYRCESPVRTLEEVAALLNPRVQNGPQPPL